MVSKLGERVQPGAIINSARRGNGSFGGAKRQRTFCAPITEQSK
jgi:hypothetical protein